MVPKPDLLEGVEADAPDAAPGSNFMHEIFGFRLAPGRGQVPKLGLLIVDDDAMGPGEKRRHHEAHALAGARGRDGGDMLRAVMAEIMQAFWFVAPAADINALAFLPLAGSKPGRLDFGLARPMGGAVDAFMALAFAPGHGKRREHP